jgi:hypothetical protein
MAMFGRGTDQIAHRNVAAAQPMRAWHKRRLHWPQHMIQMNSTACL